MRDTNNYKRDKKKHEKKELTSPPVGGDSQFAIR